MPQNPIKQIREEKEVTQHELALASDVSVSTIRNIENGEVKEINENLLNFLEDKGYNREKLVKEYKTWLQEKKEEIEDKF
ncbi:hypothetical protein C9439_00060 [archaeon SCG-AAA382B04]|nr:hypothetical protein C9439_00060 [archaeon SCG-AAA382B04]